MMSNLDIFRGKESDFFHFHCLGSLKNFSFESHLNTLMFFDKKKDMTSGLNMP